MDWTVLIDLVVLLGVAVVCPLALGHARWWWAAAGAAAVAAVVPTGPIAAACAAVWVVVAALLLTRTLASTHLCRQPAGALDQAAELVARIVPFVYALVAALAYFASRGGVTPFSVDEPIVELTAVHFTFAGVGALTLAGALAPAGSATRAIALAMTCAAPPLVALGFLTHHPLPQVGGAVLMSAGVLLVAALQLRDACASATPRRALLALSGLAPWMPMLLAVAWASSLYFRVPALSIPDMARTHGVLNVVFVIAGLLARRGRPGEPTPRPERTAPHPELVTR